MKAGVLTRLKRLEGVRAAEQQNGPPIVELGYVVKHLPPNYSGPRHLVTVARLPNGWHQWEEWPGDEALDPVSTGRQRLLVEFEGGPEALESDT